MAITLVMLQYFVRLSNRGVPWTREDGAACPLCFSILGEKIKGRVTSSPGGGVRFCQCPQCGHPFKSIEDSEAEKRTKPVKTTDSLPKKKKGR